MSRDNGPVPTMLTRVKTFLNQRYVLWVILALPMLTAADRRYTIFGESGLYGTWLLIIVMAVTPLSMLFKSSWTHWLMSRRRDLGVAAFLYALLHTVTFVERYRLERTIESFTEFSMLVGWLSLFILVPMAITSNNYSVRRLGRNWRKFHRWGYLATALALLHTAMVIPGIRSILIFVLPLALLEGYRLIRGRVGKRPSPKNTNAIKTVCFVLMGWMVAAVPALIVVELALRLSSDEWTSAQAINVIRDKRINYSVSHLYDSPKNPITYTRDKYGLRHSCKESEPISILTIGGSTTDQRYVDDEFTYQSVLRRKLSEHLRKDVCVANAGIDGHTTYGHLLAFKNWFPLIPNLNPEFVLLHIGLNDADFERMDHLNRGFDRLRGPGLRSFLMEFEIIRAVIRLRDILRGLNVLVAYGGHDKVTQRVYPATKFSPKSDALSEKNTRKFKKRLIAIIEKIEKIGAKPICVTQPHRMTMTDVDGTRGIEMVFQYRGKIYNGLDYDLSLRKINSVLREVCGANNLIDLYTFPFEDEHFYDYVHTTADGSVLIGKQIAAEFIARGFASEL